MTFTTPLFLSLLPLVLVMAAFLVARGRVRAAALNRIGDAELVQVLLAQVSFRRRRWKAMLWLLVLAALILALARPLWGIELQRIEKEGMAVMVVLDVSRSMDAQDVLPSRLERAKLDLRELFTALDGNDVGIVLFAGQPVPYMPLTYDMNAAQLFLEGATTNAITAQGTAIAAALDTALDNFDPRSSAQHIILLITDGENHEGNPRAAAQRAADEGVIIHVMGYGTSSGAVIPIYDNAGTLIDYKIDSSGALVESRLNEALLRELATSTGGIYQPIDGSGMEITNIITAVRASEPGQLGDEVVTRSIERFGIFALLALLALSLEILLPETRREA
jgi:Ca-activated chloride channel homolog